MACHLIRSLKLLYSYWRNDKDARRKTSLTIYVPLTLFVRVRKGYSRFACERELDTEQELQYFDPQSYGRQRCVFLFLQGCSTGDTEAPSAGWWLSLLHLMSNLSPAHQGTNGPFGLAWLSLPHLVYNSVRLQLQLSWLLSWLSYIIVQRPLSRLLDLWNRMFDRNQAEITVMQFTGHSLPVHQSMSVPWEFFYLVSFNQPISAHVISSHNCH